MTSFNFLFIINTILARALLSALLLTILLNSIIMAPSTTSDPCPLLSLPAELQDSIFKLLLPSARTQHYSARTRSDHVLTCGHDTNGRRTTPTKFRSAEVALLQTCKDVYHRMISLLYRNKDLVFHDTQCFRSFLSSFGQGALTHLECVKSFEILG